MTTTDVADIASQLSALTESLRASYIRLERRAERVERELVVANAKLAASAKLAALGTMAAGIAHEVRNPLNAVRGFAELLRDDLEPGLRAHRFASRICEGVDEIDGIVRSLLGLAADDRLVREEIDPAELARLAIAAARSEACVPLHSDRWSIRTRIDSPCFRADSVKLRQALKNLVANAVQAQPRGGEIAVEIRGADGWIEIRVHDAGPGLADSLRGRVGEPFLTTRAEGTGLGLALVHAIAAVHGGTFEIAACPGPLGGADARLRIPHQLP